MYLLKQLQYVYDNGNNFQGKNIQKIKYYLFKLGYISLKYVDMI